MGLLRSRASRQRRSQRHRSHLTGTNDETGDSTNPELSRSMTRHGAGDTSRKTLRKIVVYGIVFCVMQYAKRRNGAKDGSSGESLEPRITYRAVIPATVDANETAAPRDFFVMKNVLPLEVAKRWQRSLRFEWQKVQNGAWEYCTTILHSEVASTIPKKDGQKQVSTSIECHGEHVLKRNNTLQAALLGGSVPSSDAVSEWRLPGDHYVLKGMEETFWGHDKDVKDGAIHEHIEPQLIQFFASENFVPAQSRLSFHPIEFFASHLLTGDFRQDTTLHSHVSRETEANSVEVSFALFLTEDDEDSSENKDKKQFLEKTRSADTQDIILENTICSHDEAATMGTDKALCDKMDVVNVSMHFNQAAFWIGNNIKTQWRIKPVPWLSIEHGYRVFAVTGTFIARADSTMHNPAAVQPDSTAEPIAPTKEL